MNAANNSEDVAAKVAKFFAQYPKHKYEKGHILIHDGQPSKYVYYLLSGKVKEYDVTDKGDEIILNVFKLPAFFPMSLAIHQNPSQFIFEAETAVEFHQAPAEKVVEFIRANPDVMFDLLSRVYKGVEGVLRRSALLMASSAKTRLINELIIEAQRFGKPAADKIELTISEVELAARAGLTRETVSREMRELKDKQLVEIRGHKIFVANLPDWNCFDKSTKFLAN